MLMRNGVLIGVQLVSISAFSNLFPSFRDRKVRNPVGQFSECIKLDDVKLYADVVTEKADQLFFLDQYESIDESCISNDDRPHNLINDRFPYSNGHSEHSATVYENPSTGTEYFYADPVVDHIDSKVQVDGKESNSISTNESIESNYDKIVTKNNVNQSHDEKVVTEEMLTKKEHYEKPIVTLRSLWRQRNARSAEEGIRREKTSMLSDVLDKARGSMMEIENRKAIASRRFAARTITGVINALAEEVNGLDVQVNSDPKTPFWKKQVDDITIQFSRLGFKPLRISGGVHERGQKTHHFQARSLLGIYDNFVVNKSKWGNAISDSIAQTGRFFPSIDSKQSLSQKMDVVNGIPSPFDEMIYSSPTADEAFDRIDIDNSGYLDRDELIQALKLAAMASFEDVDENNQHIIEKLASDLFELYDLNGDGVVDRKEYKSMVTDMAALRQKQLEQEYKLDQQEKKKNQSQQDANYQDTKNGSWFPFFWKRNISKDEGVEKSNRIEDGTSESPDPWSILGEGDTKVQVLDSEELEDSMTQTLGSITLSDVKLDLRQLLFGAVPIIKHVTPGGPLVLEPFTVTVNGSFKREDIMNSASLDAGLRRLVARVLRIRVGFVRDFLEGAVFYGRSWNMFGESGPKVEVPELTEVEFDENNKLIITGTARVRTSPTSPVVVQAFKVRTSIGTRQNGRFIRLEEPELALVVECPKSWERSIDVMCDALKIKRRKRPKPLYSFFPIYSPLKLNEDDGFDLGDDNTINSLYISDGALCFEMSSVLRPGRFLGSHYIAFSVPNRTFIVTVDRVMNAIRAARKTKKAADAWKKATRRSKPRQSRRKNGNVSDHADDATKISSSSQKRVQPPKVRGFFARFVDGYLQAEREEAKKESVTTAIRDYFGRQGADLIVPSRTLDSD